MNRRHVLAAAFGVASGLTGCLSAVRDGTDGGSTTGTAMPTTVRATGDGVAATFRVVDGHEPTADAASATFDGATVTVTGTADPTGCNRPTLSSVRYNGLDRVILLTVGETSPYGETATVVCDNASYDYRCEVTVDADGDPPEAVDLLHQYDGKENRSFNLTRG